MGLPSQVVQTLVFAKMDQDGHRMLHVSPRSGNLDRLAMVLGSEHKFVQVVVKDIDHSRVERLGNRGYFDVIKMDEAMTPRGAALLEYRKRIDDLSKRYGLELSPRAFSGDMQGEIESVSRQARRKLTPEVMKRLMDSQEDFLERVRGGFAGLSNSKVDESVDLLEHSAKEDTLNKAESSGHDTPRGTDAGLKIITDEFTICFGSYDHDQYSDEENVIDPGGIVSTSSSPSYQMSPKDKGSVEGELQRLFLDLTFSKPHGKSTRGKL